MIDLRARFGHACNCKTPTHMNTLPFIYAGYNEIVGHKPRFRIYEAVIKKLCFYNTQPPIKYPIESVKTTSI